MCAIAVIITHNTVKVSVILHKMKLSTIRIRTSIVIISDSKSCLSGLNWPRSGKNYHFLALFGLVEGTLGIRWKRLVFGL